MIGSFGSNDTERIWLGEQVTKLPLEVQKIGRRKLRMTHNSQTTADLRVPPANRLEKLAGNPKEFQMCRRPRPCRKQIPATSNRQWQWRI